MVQRNRTFLAKEPSFQRKHNGIKEVNGVGLIISTMRTRRQRDDVI